MEIADCRVRKLRVPCDPPISDSQTDDHELGLAYLELEAETGETGVGFGGVRPDEPPAAVERRYERAVDAVRGESPFHVTGQMRRPRGGNYGDRRFGAADGAVDVACWDLCARHLGVPLYELLGGTDSEVPVYASGLLFSVDDEAVRRRYASYADRGFDAAKVKVGYDTLAADLDRLELVRDAMGGDPTLMVDANGAWSPKEAVRRVHAYRDAGFDVYWVEDPVLRDDVDGARDVSEAVPFAHVNVGEYVGLEGKRDLLAAGAADVLHLSGGWFSVARQEAAMAHAHGVPVALHDAVGHVCVHLAAALPELAYMEYWPRPWDGLLASPPDLGDGTLHAPDGPGHGVRFGEDAFAAYGE